MVTSANLEGVDASYAEIAEFFDAFAAVEPHWRSRNASYHRMVEQLFCFSIPSGARVLELGCGSGHLLAALRPARGLGVDLSAGMVALAGARHPELEFVQGTAESFEAGERFDYVVLSDLVPYVHDVLALLDNVVAHSHPGTRVIVQSYSAAWRPILRLAELLRLRPRKPVRNWISPRDMADMCALAGFDVIATRAQILLPKRIPLLSSVINGVLAAVWPFNRLCLTWWLVARPSGGIGRGLSVSVVCPCRNEVGTVEQIFERMPELGSQTELVFVEGGSTDATRSEIERQIALHPGVDARLVDQLGSGKGDAVRAGIAVASGEVVMILDGDLSVDPEDLTRFYRALVEGRGELINGSRLVYDPEPQAMRFLNLVGNRAFSRLFEAITGQRIKDTLCGTKALLRTDYERIAEAREYFGDFDPFGDFDLLFGAARLGLKIVDLPVRYRRRTYGQTNISRFRDGWLLARMTAFAFWKFRVAVFGTRTD